MSNITFVPTPRLEYTLAYNRQLESLKYQDVIDRRQNDYQEKIKLAKFHEEQRMLEKRKLEKELIEFRQYAALAKQKGYYDYKYAYWVGTLVDQYI